MHARVNQATGVERQVDTIKPRAHNRHTTYVNHTFAIREKGELVATYIVEDATVGHQHVLVGEGTSCMTFGPALKKKMEKDRSHPLLLAALDDQNKEEERAGRPAQLPDTAKTQDETENAKQLNRARLKTVF